MIAEGEETEPREGSDSTRFSSDEQLVSEYGFSDQAMSIGENGSEDSVIDLSDPGSQDHFEADSDSAQGGIEQSRSLE
jgi:hypothetical protein